MSTTNHLIDDCSPWKKGEGMEVRGQKYKENHQPQDRKVGQIIPIIDEKKVTVDRASSFLKVSFPRCSSRQASAPRNSLFRENRKPKRQECLRNAPPRDRNQIEIGKKAPSAQKPIRRHLGGERKTISTRKLVAYEPTQCSNLFRPYETVVRQFSTSP